MKREWANRASGMGVRVLAALAMAVASAAAAGAQRTLADLREKEAQLQEVSLSGSVRSTTGRTITSGVTVRLVSTRGETIDEQLVSTAGQFTFHNLRKMPVVMLVTADGFQRYEQTVDLAVGANELFVTIMLTPADEKQAAAANLPSRTDATAPKEARKEWEKGARALESKKLKEARTHFEKAVSAYPCYARAQADLAATLMADRDSAAAEKALHKSIECDPDFINAYMELGQLLNAEKKYNESWQVLEQGVRRSPGSWQFHYQLGQARYGLMQYAKAEQEFLQAQSLSSADSSDLHVKLADVYLKESSYQKAYSELQAYLDVQPNGRFAPKAKDIMQQMKSAGVVHAVETNAAPSAPKPQP